MAYEFFEEAIKAYIEHSERSQAGVARLLGVEADTFNKWVRGVNRMPIDVLHQFCELMKLSEAQRTELFALAGYAVPPVVTDTPASVQSQQDMARLDEVVLPEKPYRDLIGRELLVEDLLAALSDPAGKRMVAIDGLGGIGKTALAREVVDCALAEQQFEQAVWVQAPREEFIDQTRSKRTGTLTYDTVLDSIARQLGAVEVFKLRGNEKEVRLRTWLQRQPALIVLDNMETAKEPQQEIADRLRPLLGPSKALLTSRQRFQGDVYSVHLKGLDETSAVRFIHQEAEEKNIKRVATAEPEELTQIATATGGSPLALKLVAGQLEMLDLATVLSLLQQVQVPDQSEETDEYFHLYQGIFFSSWKLLAEESRALLIAMTHFAPGVGGTLDAIRTISNLGDPVFTRSVKQLWRYSFIEVGEASTLKQIRYYLHALTQYFVLADIVKII